MNTEYNERNVLLNYQNEIKITSFYNELQDITNFSVDLLNRQIGSAFSIRKGKPYLIPDHVMKDFIVRVGFLINDSYSVECSLDKKFLKKMIKKTIVLEYYQEQFLNVIEEYLLLVNKEKENAI